MKIHNTSIREVKIIEPEIFPDNRGIFYELINTVKLKEYGIDFNIVQENYAFSVSKGTFRGFHFQVPPFTQAKLVRCTLGSVIDYAIDLRKNSNTFLSCVAAKLTPENRLQLLIPRGFAHGVMSLEDNTLIEYYEDNIYSPAHGRNINFSDPEIDIQWDYVDKVFLSDHDRNAPFLKDLDYLF